MALTKENLHQLIALQEQDASLDKLRAQMSKIPAQIEAIRAGLDGEKSRLAGLKARTLEFEKKKKEKELDLASKEEAVRKHGQELNQVKTNEAFKALQHEIDAAKAQADQLETEILEIMVALDTCRKDERVAAADMKILEQDVGSEAAMLEGQFTEIKARHDAARGGRDAAAAPISADAMKIYDHIRSRGKLDAVVAIDQNNCSACRITLAPQVIVEATKAKGLVTCESCQRILYKPEPAAAKA